ncbi:MarR family winged helix-turn-helix transcriptional regulator [Paucilactobacillus suebicus]|uniref:MarR family winged helix-turn-helix transcriptional regulator n=1 Tax=Paucilactobacillus suebicus TaxID=152335 RepID=UPI000249021F|nr:MarR family winged helix-turn-helix transcriptional regulator [Paucilactobacillus suebicus]
MENVLRSIGTIARALDSIANIEFRPLNLARGQYLYLVRICETPGIIQEQLVHELKVDRATVARSVKKLVDHGLVKKEVDKNNRKINHLLPTHQGMRVYPTIKKENEYSTTMSVQGLSTDEVEELARLLDKMSVNVGRDWQYVKDGNHRSY